MQRVNKHHLRQNDEQTASLKNIEAAITQKQYLQQKYKQSCALCFFIVICILVFCFALVIWMYKIQTQRIEMKNEIEQKLSESVISPINQQIKQVKPIIQYKKIKNYEISSQQLQNAIKYHKLRDNYDDPIGKIQYKYYQDKYEISKYKELPFCIVMNSYNNEAKNRVDNSLNSVFGQNYSNYHVVYIDDFSTDNTLKNVKNYIQRNPNFKQKIEIVENKKNMGINYNYLLAANYHCKREEIFMIVDGDDELLGRQVLKLFNTVFQDTKAYFIYSQLLFSNLMMGWSSPFPDEIISQNQYRMYPFVSGHLQAFYTQLLLKIDDINFKDQKNQWFKTAGDVALSIPLLQLSHLRIQYIPQITYFYNLDTGINDATIRLSEQKNTDKFIRSYQRLKPLDKLYDQNPFGQIGFKLDR